MKDYFGPIATLFVMFVAVLGLTWIVQGNEFFMYKFFAPKEEAVRREVFEQSKAYKTGMIQELQNMQFEYIKSNSEQKAALKSIILHRAADFNVDDLPPDLRSFIESLKQ